MAVAKMAKKKPRKRVEESERKPAPRRASGSASASAAAKAAPKGPQLPFQQGVQEALASLKQMSTKHDRENLARFGIMGAEETIGKRSPALNAAAVKVAQRLSASPNAAARWVGKDAIRELASPAMTRRLAGRRRAAEK